MFTVSIGILYQVSIRVGDFRIFRAAGDMALKRSLANSFLSDNSTVRIEPVGFAWHYLIRQAHGQ